MTCTRDCETCLYAEKKLVSISCASGQHTCNGDCQYCTYAFNPKYQITCGYNKFHGISQTRSTACETVMWRY